jgi:hypothetical protein
MKFPFEIFFRRTILVLSLGSFLVSFDSFGKTGFSLPDSLSEFTLRYNTIDNLILLPVRINDSIEVNLVLDTGCRNILLFGKRFQKLFGLDPNRKIEFSGMGNGKTVKGSLALTNHATIGMVKGENVPIVVIPERRVFLTYNQIDGLIGYDIFTRFEVEIQPSEKLITFRSAFDGYIPNGYAKIPLRIVDSKPILDSRITIQKETLATSLLIDTGSSLGLLLKSSDKKYLGDYPQSIGRGLNGLIKGALAMADRVQLDSYELKHISAGIIHSPWHNYASIGMDILKDYSLILNYMKSYACLKKNE